MSDDDNLEYRFQNLHEFVKAARRTSTATTGTI